MAVESVDFAILGKFIVDLFKDAFQFLPRTANPSWSAAGVFNLAKEAAFVGNYQTVFVLENECRAIKIFPVILSIVLDTIKEIY